jgi:multisubunit Na+/H+ antiporter MnhB subunit
VTSILGAVTLSRAEAGGIAAGVLLLMYLMNVVAQVQPDFAWLADFGAFRYLAVTELVDEGIVPWASIAVFTVVAVVGWVASIVVFRRRDLLA